MSSSSSISGSFFESTSLSSESHIISEIGKSGFGHLNRMERASQFFATVAVVSFVATIAILGLTLAEYVHPIASMYSFGGCIAAFVIMGILHCAQGNVAKKHGIDLEAYHYERKRQGSWLDAVLPDWCCPKKSEPMSSLEDEIQKSKKK